MSATSQRRRQRTGSRRGADGQVLEVGLAAVADHGVTGDADDQAADEIGAAKRRLQLVAQADVVKLNRAILLRGFQLKRRGQLDQLSGVASGEAHGRLDTAQLGGELDGIGLAHRDSGVLGKGPSGTRGRPGSGLTAAGTARRSHTAASIDTKAAGALPAKWRFAPPEG